MAAGCDEVQRVLPHRPAGERPPAAPARADAVAVTEHVQRAHVVRHERDQRARRRPATPRARPRAGRRGANSQRGGERGQRIERRRRMDEDREPEQRPGGDPEAPAAARPRPSARAPSTTSATRRASCAAGRTSHRAPGSARLRSGARRRRPHRRRRARRRTISATAGSARHRKTSDGHAERRQSGPPAEQEVLEPEVQRPAAALRRDDVEDVAEREVAEPERQLLVHVQRRPPDRRQREPGQQARGRDDRGREKELAYSVWEVASACISGVSGAVRYGCSSATSVSW